MFSSIRGLLASLQRLITAIESLSAFIGQLVEIASEGGELTDRVKELEESRTTWETTWQAERVLFEAKLEGDQAKAQSKYQAARNAEERAKTMANASADDGDLASEAGVLEAYRQLGWVPAGDVDGSEADEVSPLHEGVGVGPKSSALRAKFRTLRGGP